MRFWLLSDGKCQIRELRAERASVERLTDEMERKREKEAENKRN